MPLPLDKLIAGALADHLRRAIEDVAESPARRAEVLLALRDLATDDGKRNEGRVVQELEDALDAGILKKLGDEYRVLYRERREGREYFLLSHDRIAEAVLGEMANPRNKEWLDAELISLRPLVSSKAALLNHDPVEATSMSAENHRCIASHAKTLLWDKPRKDWWAACVRRNRARIAELEAGLSSGSQPDRALEILDELSDLDLGRPELADLLEKRPDLASVFEEGPARVLEARRNAIVLAAADCCAQFLPVRLKKDLDSCAPALGALLWALDYGPMRDPQPTVVDQARAIRRLIVGSLRERCPSLPQLRNDDWALIPGGTFQMGSEAEEAFSDERPVHTVEVSSYRLLKHQVTNAEFAELFGGPWTDEAATKPRHPAIGVTWYQAYVFSAWLGGRLPTEAEWEYAARSGEHHQRYPYPWGDATDDICRRAVVAGCGHSGPLPVGSRPNGNTVQGVSDMAGNVREWVGDWHRKYTSEPQKDPWGPVSGGDRAFRGGSFDLDATRARVSNRFRWVPDLRVSNLGFRVLVAAAPEDGS